MTENDALRFEFGKNWDSFRAQKLSDESIVEAKRGLERLFGVNGLRGKSFLDIGSGSGLMSLAAIELGAARVLSFDYDADSVACTQSVRDERAGGAGRAPWDVMRGSVLDEAFVSKLGTFDVVYSWGVLHHTGDMWKAVANAMIPVASGGFFAIAIYNKVTGSIGTFSSESWEVIKRAYNAGSKARKEAMLAMFIGWRVGIYLSQLKNPFRMIRDYKSSRGMSWTHDARDWLGGYPYEYATADELERFVVGKGFKTRVRLPTGDDEWGNHELVFERP